MGERITLHDLQQRCANVSRRLEGTGRFVQVQGRNGYFDLDEFADSIEIAGERRTNQVLRTITCGTKREVGDFLHAMMVGIDLSRTPR